MQGAVKSADGVFEDLSAMNLRASRGVVVPGVGWGRCKRTAVPAVGRVDLTAMHRQCGHVKGVSGSYAPDRGRV